MNIRVEGNTAIVTGINHVIGRDPQGKAFDRRARFSFSHNCAAPSPRLLGNSR
jgi:ketosteroid isomerase-like protein